MSTLTSGLTRPGPVIGSRSSRMRWLNEVSWRRTCSNWAALTAASLLGSVMLSMRPLWSTTVTRSGARSGMLAATMCTMASTWLRSSCWPPRSSRVTEALATSRWRVKALGLGMRSEEHTSELQSQSNLVCRLLLEKKKKREKEVKMTYIDYDRTREMNN